jgi:hypothetical protein
MGTWYSSVNDEQKRTRIAFAPSGGRDVDGLRAVAEQGTWEQARALGSVDAEVSRLMSDAEAEEFSPILTPAPTI